MKKVRIVISEKGLKVLEAFLEDNYLNSYIASNENELYYKNIMNSPDLIGDLKNGIVLFAKDNISSDDEYVLIDTMSDMKKKNATYYCIIYDTKTLEIKEFSNDSGKIILPFSNLDTFEKLRNIENYVYEQFLIEEMEM